MPAWLIALSVQLSGHVRNASKDIVLHLINGGVKKFV
jgi:hypothetical protein